MSATIATDVLRYWAALLRQEEALAVRPKARRGSSQPSTSPVASPRPGQDYVKLPFAGNEKFLLQAQETLSTPITPDVSVFFEDWLYKQYRSGGEDGRLEHLVSFPTVLLPRDELAGLLRFSADVQWWREGKRFELPKSRQRSQGEVSEPPDVMKLDRGGAVSDEALPYFIDTRLLRDVLRIDGERLDAFFNQAKERTYGAAELVVAVCELLEAQLRDDGQHLPAEALSLSAGDAPKPQQRPPAELLQRLHQLTTARLRGISSRCRAFPVALLLDASRNRTTFHVQRDLQAALARLEESQLEPAHPLMAYLNAAPERDKSVPAVTPTRQPIVGRFRGAGLTASQRDAAEIFLGAQLTAVQGPPGTGKTHVILTLAASELIRKVSFLQRIKHPGPDLLLVTSTNNRAVENVVRPLGQELTPSELPLALRVGSRDVTEKVTQTELLRAKSWLERQPEVTEAELQKAVSDFAAADKRVSTRLAALHAEYEAERHLAALERALAALPEESAAAAATAAVETSLGQLGVALSDAPADVLDELMQCLRELSLRLRVLSELAEPTQATAPKHLALHFKVTRHQQLRRLEKILGAPLELGLPPALPGKTPAAQAREAWEDAAEEALGLVTALRDALEGPAKQKRRAVERERLTRELNDLRGAARPPAAEIDWPASELEQAALFEAAVRLREAWARANKKALVPALTHAAQTCARTRSLRALLEATKGPGVWLKRLYPVWGCTLLSMGNNFSPDKGMIRRVVIDEAGQCHGAYAVSALLRAESALVIGDVNQLEPVVELTAADESRLLKGLALKSGSAELAPFRVYQGSDTSAQSIADRAVSSRPTLIDHFRCQVEIATICDELCGYGLVTHTPRRSHESLVSALSYPLLFSAVNGAQQRFAGSWVNPAELAEVTRWIQHLLRAGLRPSQLGVITPFRGQLEGLWRELRAARVPLERPMLVEDLEQTNLFGAADSGVALGTVHRFQGGERSVILFSTTITEARSLPFVDERVNLVNVAASRAREHLVTIGHGPTLRAGQNTRSLVGRARPAAPES